MRTPLTIGQFIAFLAFIVVPSIAWVINAERKHDQITENRKDITDIKIGFRNKIESDNRNFDLVIEKLHGIELQLKDKEDRE